jgi:hypothetical protein
MQGIWHISRPLRAITRTMILGMNMA